MALAGRIERHIEIDASAELFYHIWKNESYRVRTASPANIVAVDVHQGQWHEHGAVKHWTYNIDGRTETFKERVEHDDSNMSVTHVGMEGHVFEHFGCWSKVYKVTPRWDGRPGCIVTCSIEYEKLHARVPDPYAYLDFMASVSNDVAAHITRGYC